MDELDRLKAALRAERPEPSPAARRAAVAAALAAFDARQTEARQGSVGERRLRSVGDRARAILKGFSMTSIPLRHALAGGASVAVLALAVMTAANLQTFDGFSRGAAPVAPVAPTQDSVSSDVAAPEVAQMPAAPQRGADARAKIEARPAEAERQVVQSGAMTDDSAQIAAAPPPPVEMRTMSPAAEALSVAPAFDASTVASMPQAAPQGFVSEPMPQPSTAEEGRDRFETLATNPLKVTAEEPVSTFSIDVDTASYAFMRASLNDGVLPPDDSVRVEELVNYFPYDYAAPASAEEPFRATATVMPTPWNASTKLVHIGIKGFDIAPAAQPHANLVFLIDTSGSMEEANKLPLLINAMKLLVDGLQLDDTVAIVTYAGSAGTVLEPTKASDKGAILAALENLSAGGSTAGAEGIDQAYKLAKRNFDAEGVNRVILATDGDFNVGVTDDDTLEGFVARERESGVFLSVLGFGRGNYNDALMQTLAQNGNGAAAYIDTLSEARKVLVEEAGSTLFPIAKDVKLQVEFNPATVSEYRLIGYETRLLNREDFNNDRADAGEIGSGHTVTALYEITPAGSGAERVDALRYGGSAGERSADSAAPSAEGEYGFLKIRYKLPDEDTSRLIETPIDASEAISAEGGGTAAQEARFATSVAAFGQILRGGRYTGDFGYDDVIALANGNRGADEFGYRAEFVNLVRLAKSAASMRP